MTENNKRIQEAIERYRLERELKLVGECKKCGQCCIGLLKIYQCNNEKKSVDLVRHGEKQCIHYDEETKTCKNYQGREHAMCYMFPYLPENQYPGCGFRFEKVDMVKPNTLDTGESSVGKNIGHCTKDQLWRYVQSLDYIKRTDTVLDLGCGCGYGSYILAHKAKKVMGTDNRKEIIEYGNQYYQQENLELVVSNIEDLHEQYDVVVALEFIEHVENVNEVFEKFKEVTKRTVIISTPHINAVNNNPFHFKHFTEQEIEEGFKKIGFAVREIHRVSFAGGPAVFCVAQRRRK